MNLARYSLLAIVTIPIFCILEPYERREEKGVCYQGYDEYQQLIQDDKVRIEALPPLQDTVVIDTSEKEIDMEYVCHIDTSYFNCGEYEMEVVYSSVVSPGLPQSSDKLYRRKV